MRRALVAVLLLGSLTACAPAVDDRPLVVVTTNILGDVVQNVVGDEVEVMTLMRPNSDPHSFEISAREAARILGADLIVANGLGLEEGLIQHLSSAAEAGVPIVEAGEVIEVLDYSESGAPDPHFWTDPGRMLPVIEAVRDAVLEHVPGVDAETVTASAAAYAREVVELEASMITAFETIAPEHRRLVTNHHVFGYLAERFGFEIVGAVIPGGSTLAAPSASDLRDLVGAINEAGVTTIFAESSQPDRLVQVLAEEADLRVTVTELYTESLSEPDEPASTYLTMMRTNTERITTGLAR